MCYTQVWGNGKPDIERASSAALMRAFPGINFVRFACWRDALANPTDAAVQAWVSDLTSNGLVVEAEVHYTGNAISGGDLAHACNWLASWASAYKDNPLVIFGTQNEPHGDDIDDMMWAMYQAVRKTGNGNLVFLCTGNPGNELQGMDSTANMRNVAFDMHYYGWSIPQGWDWSYFRRQAAQYHSQDGVIPVACLETGDSTDGNNIDPNWQRCLSDSLGNTNGFAAWMWNWAMTSGGGDCLLAAPFDGTHLTDYGQVVARAVAKQ